MSGFLYELRVDPDPYDSTKWGLLTPKAISCSLEVPFLKFGIHYPEYRDCSIHRRSTTSRPTMRSKTISGTVEIQEIENGDKQNAWNFNEKKWRWILDFNK